MNPIQVRPKKKYRLAVGSNHKSSHSDGTRRKGKAAKHALWTTPGNIWHAMYGGKLPPPQPARKMILENGRTRMVLA